MRDTQPISCTRAHRKTPSEASLLNNLLNTSITSLYSNENNRSPCLIPLELLNKPEGEPFTKIEK